MLYDCIVLLYCTIVLYYIAKHACHSRSGRTVLSNTMIESMSRNTTHWQAPEHVHNHQPSTEHVHQRR